MPDGIPEVSWLRGGMSGGAVGAGPAGAATIADEDVAAAGALDEPDAEFTTSEEDTEEEAAAAAADAAWRA